MPCALRGGGHRCRCALQHFRFPLETCSIRHLSPSRSAGQQQREGRGAAIEPVGSQTDETDDEGDAADHRAQRWQWPADSSAVAEAVAVAINNYSRGLLFLLLPLHCRPTCRPMPPSQSALRCTRGSQTLAIVHPTFASSSPLQHQSMTVTSQVRIGGLRMTRFEKPHFEAVL